MLNLQPGTPEHKAFIAAAREAGPHPAPSMAASRAPEFITAGREHHLQWLRRAIDAAVAGRAGVVLIEADAGAGKSWLIAEACRRALDRHPDLAVLWTECLSRFGDGPSLEPFRSMLALMTGDDAASVASYVLTARNVAVIHSRIPAAVTSLSTRALELVGSLLPVSALRRDRLTATLDEDQRRTLEAAIRHREGQEYQGVMPVEPLATLLADYAAAGPLVLVVEDLHWADSGTLATLAELRARMDGRPVPLLLISSRRPGDAAQPPMPVTTLDLSTAIGGDAGRAFVEAMVAASELGDHPALARDLFDRTGGHPLFVASYLRLVAHSSREAAVSVGSERVPAEIRAVFAQQLYQLPAEVRSLLSAASVQGDEFIAEPLMRMLDLDA
jgi:predicted ATPase